MYGPGSQSIVTALSFAISFALVDLWAASRGGLGRLSGLEDLPSLIAVLGTGFVIGLAVYLVARVLFVWPVARRRPGQVERLEIATAVFLLSVTGIASLLDLDRSGTIGERLFRLSLAAFASLAPGYATYAAARAAKESEAFRSLPGAVVFIAPLFWTAVLTFDWLRAFRPHVAGGAAVTGVVLALPVVVSAPLLWSRIRRPKIELGVLAPASAALLVGLGIGIHSARPAGLPERVSLEQKHRFPRIILVSIDTLRADALSCYGDRGVPTPNIDALAADGVRFERAISPAPWTLPAVASIMTGLAPNAHTANGAGLGWRLPEGLQTLPERLSESGYVTAGVVSNYLLGPRFNFAQGFDQFRVFPKGDLGRSVAARLLSKAFRERFRRGISTDRLTQLSVDWLSDHADRNFLFWVHFYDPHDPYAPPKRFRPDGPPPARIGWRMASSEAIQRGFVDPTDEEREWIRKLYEGEVRHVDWAVGEIIGALERLGLYDDALIVVVSDHGEEFWEHGRLGHGHTLFQELLHVPLIFKLPSPGVRGTVDAPVSTTSILPTLLDVAGIRYDPADFSEPSLAPLWSVGSDGLGPKPPISEDWNLRVAVQNRHWKYVRDSSGQYRIYDLLTDPNEVRPLASDTAALHQEFDAILRRYAEAAAELRRRFAVDEKAAPISRAEVDALRALGYVQ